MPFKEPLPDNSCPILPGFSLLELEGPQAAAFAQAQFSNDVSALEPEHWHWSAWLTPKGRVIALFALLRLGEDRLWLVLPDHPAESLAAALQRYVFRSRVLLRPRPDLVAAVGPAEPGEVPDLIVGEPGSGIALDMGAPDLPRCLLVLPAAHPALAAPDTGAEGAWLAADLALGFPRLDPRREEAWTPQMLSLERLGAYSLRKGCYPGQEIVARTHYLGQAKRGLVRLAGEGLAAGRALEPAGAVVCALADGSQALAVTALESPAPSLEGRQLQRLPLLDGLRRPR
ncbi:YgfZ/GcvT domain-containing protein [Arenimonas fontis]|uniref:Folate-binding protein YgfZ n=1 Tax=Arenimonas fontis TaxID=2608255 RepID=A0A5B2ZBD4_9GAMM|nr:folate-binding protein YgfZ [Arenimonas fontis]KAA2284442.1 folate-binding protein YgfZ [Arenimonas fontis]